MPNRIALPFFVTVLLLIVLSLLTGSVGLLGFALGLLASPLLDLLFSWVSYLVWRKRLAKGVLKVDGHEFTFPYTVQWQPFGYSFKSLDEPSAAPVEFFAAVAHDEVEIHTQVLDYDAAEYPQVPATLNLEHKEFHFTMSVMPKRCECASEIPCWTGKTYIGTFAEKADGEQWQGAIATLVIDPPRRRRFRRPRPKLSWPENWSLLPELSPSAT
jgi:hypothetical protein